VPALLSGDRQRADALVRGRLATAYEEHRAAIDNVVRLARAESVAHEAAVGRMLDDSHAWLSGLTASLFALLVGLAFAVRSFSRSLTGRIGVVASSAERVAGGDLTVRFEPMGSDEVGQMVDAVRSMTVGLASLVARVKESSSGLLVTATQIAETSGHQGAAVTAFGSATSSAAAAAREISETGRRLRATVDHIATMTRGASSEAQQGRAALSDMAGTMSALSDSTRSVSTKLVTIRDRAADINGIVTTITDVSEATSLLSVNAAIEAEKAGEYGRGFLVLAREIRRLADQTAISTLDIERLIRTMQSAVDAGVTEMDSFSAEMTRGQQRVDEVARTLAGIIERVSAVLDQFELLGDGVVLQSAGAETISASISSLDTSAKRTATSVRDLNQAAAEMREAVDLLRGEIAAYRVGP
jgi:methyl-accepting chemotaxis protein WspA